jgi:putative transposase
MRGDSLSIIHCVRHQTLQQKEKHMPYEYRHMTPEQREAIVRLRASRGFPLHAPPHPLDQKTYYLITAANYEHKHIVRSPERRTAFQKLVLETLQENSIEVDAWVFLANHYHLLTFVPIFAKLSLIFNRLHGATSRQWNIEDGQTGRRKVWFEFTDRMIRGEAHYYSTLNYIHYNPVKHKYTARMDEWEWSSFHWYLQEKGRDWLVEIWQKYPIKGYGEKWDIF